MHTQTVCCFLSTAYRRYGRALNILYFLFGLVLAVMYITIPIPGGFFYEEKQTVALEGLVLLLGLLYSAFRKPLVKKISLEISDPEAVAALLLAIGGSFYITRRFYNTFFLEILNGGNAPGLVWSVYCKIPLADPVKAFCVRFAVTLGGIMSTAALFFLAAYCVRLAKLVVRHTLEKPDYEPFVPEKRSRRRFAVAGGISLVTLVLCFFSLNHGQGWGADYSAYIRQAIDMSEHRPELVDIVWGYSALLMPVYQIVGYDMTSFSSVIYYKIPGVICLAALAFVLYLFFDRRFRPVLAVALTAVFAFGSTFVLYTNEILTHIPYLLFSMLSLVFLQGTFTADTKNKQLLCGVLAGVAIAAADLIRLNGILLVLTLLCAQAGYTLCLLLKQKGFFGGFLQYNSVKSIPAQLAPYAVYFLTKRLCALLLHVNTFTSNSIAVAPSVLGVPILDGLAYYGKLMVGFLESLLPFNLFPELAVCVFAPLILIGLIRTFRREILLQIYFFGTLVFFSLLAFRQGLRYIFPILPILILYLGVGIETVAECTQKEAAAHTGRGAKRGALVLVCCALAGGLLLESTTYAASNMANHREYDRQSFSASAKETYRYIQEYTEDNAVVVFFKPSVIRLNTGRKATRQIPQTGDAPIYLLITNDSAQDYHQIPFGYESLEEAEANTPYTFLSVLENERFELYHVVRAGD